jgi:hypothetical protein
VACIVNYEQAQARVNAEYEAAGDNLSRLGVKLGNTMKEMHVSVFKLQAQGAQ